MDQNKCDFCICKTCEKENCRDCYLCLGTPNQHGVNACVEYYNSIPKEQFERFIKKESQD